MVNQTKRIRKPTHKMNIFIQAKKLINLAKALSSKHRWALTEICMWCDDLNGTQCSCSTAPWMLPAQVNVAETVDTHFRWNVDINGSIFLISCPVEEMDSYTPFAEETFMAYTPEISEDQEESEMDFDLNVPYGLDLNVKFELN